MVQITGGNIILLTDLFESRLRRQKELKFYEEELKNLQEKMFWIKCEIDLTNSIINMIGSKKI